jgi:spectinomycin phosphotransferase
MKTENPSIELAAITDLLADQYGESLPSLVFTPVGGDSWCFRAGSLWVSVRRDRQGHAAESYEAAAELSEQGLHFVLAPLRGKDHHVVHRVSDYPVVVSPFVAGSTLHATTPHEVNAVASLVSQLHSASVRTPAPHEDYRFPFQDELEQALSLATSHDPESGPFSQRTHRLIHAHRAYLDALQAEARHLASYCRSQAGEPVLTHGEPNGNVMQTDDGRLLLFDWGTTALGPPERDWWVFPSNNNSISCRPEFTRFYELRWILGEIAEYTWRFMHQHVGDIDDASMWDELCIYFPPSTAL